MLNRARVDEHALSVACGGHLDYPAPKALRVAPKIPANALAFTPHVRFVDVRSLGHVCRYRWRFPDEKQFVHYKRVLAVRVRKMPKRAEHSAQAARSKYLHAGREGVREWRVWRHGTGRLGDTERVAEHGEDTHTVVGCALR